MTGWSAMVGTHDFAVPDDSCARELAEALVAHGFAYVTAQTSPYGGWTVTAVDDGPYPVDARGHRTIAAVGRAAAVVARRHGGYARGGSRCDVSMVEHLRRPDAPIVRTNPGARPPMPTVVVVDPPPAAPLALSPDHAEDKPVELPGLDDVAWSELEHAHGSAEDIPDLLLALTDPFGDWDEVLDELFGDDLLHQGSCCSATAPALPFLTALITSGALPARQRLELYVWLLIAAGCWADGLLADAGRAAVEGRPPRPRAWTTDVHLTVGEQVPALLERWEAEPPAGQFALACLAALYPEHGRRIADRIAGLAEAFHGTRPGAYLRLADALARCRDEPAMSAATDIVAWEISHGPEILTAEVPVPVRAGHVLAAGALRPLSNTE